MSNIQSVPVTASATVGDEDIYVTEITVERSLDAIASHAKITGVVTDLDAIELNDRVEVFVNEKQLFVGGLKQVTQDEAGIVTIDAYDLLYEMHNTNVIIQPEDDWTARSTLVTALKSFGYTVGNRPDEDAQIYVAESDRLVGDALKSRRGYGGGKSGEKLSTVISDLADRMLCQVWTDASGQLRIEPWPHDAEQYDAGYILSLSDGDNQEKNSRTVIQGSSPTSDLGAGARWIYSETSIEASATAGNVPDSVADGTPVISESESSKISGPSVVDYRKKNDVTTQEEAEKTAASVQSKELLSTTTGTIEIVGSVEVDPFDQIRIPDIGNDRYSNFDAPIYDLEIEGKFYGVQSVTHTIDTEDGFITEVSLFKDFEDSVGGLEAQLADAYAEKIRDNYDYEGTLEPVLGFEI